MFAAADRELSEANKSAIRPALLFEPVLGRVVAGELARQFRWCNAPRSLRSGSHLLISLTRLICCVEYFNKFDKIFGLMSVSFP